jgi:hypothetical protein
MVPFVAAINASTDRITIAADITANFALGSIKYAGGRVWMDWNFTLPGATFDGKAFEPNDAVNYTSPSGSFTGGEQKRIDGLRRCSIVRSDYPTILVDAALETAFPVYGVTGFDDKINYFFLTTFPGQNVLFNLKREGLLVGQFLFENRTRSIWANINLDYAVVQGSIRSFTISDILTTTVQSIPSIVSPDAFLSQTIQVNPAFQAAALGAKELMGLMALGEGMSVAGNAADTSIKGAFGLASQKRQNEFISQQNDIRRALLQSELTKSRKYGLVSSSVNTGLQYASKSALQKQGYYLNNAYMQGKSGLGVSSQSARADGMTNTASGVDDKNRVVQTTPGGTTFVQDWNKVAKTPKTKLTANVLQQTGDGPEGGMSYRTQNTPTTAMSGPSEGVQADIEVDPTMPFAPQGTTTGVGDGDVNQYERLNAMDGTEAHELNPTSPVNQDGNIIMIDEDELHGATQA